MYSFHAVRAQYTVFGSWTQFRERFFENHWTVPGSGGDLARVFREKLYRRALESYIGRYALRKIKKNPRAFLQPVCQPAELILLSQMIVGLAGADLDAWSAFHLRNYYLSSIVEQVHKEGGTVVDFSHSGVFSVWGLESPADPRSAAAAALAAGRLTPPAGRENFRVVGALHGGECLVGNIGSREKLKFTVLGPPVDFVLSLPEPNRSEASLLVTEALRPSLSDAYSLRPVSGPSGAGSLYALEDSDSS